MKATRRSYLVRFEGVGRRRLTWEDRIAGTASGLLESSLELSVRRSGALMSSDLSVVFDDDASPWSGTIAVGFGRVIGTFRLVESAQAAELARVSRVREITDDS